MRSNPRKIGPATLLLALLTLYSGHPAAAQKYRVVRLPMIGAVGRFDAKPSLTINNGGQVAGASVYGFDAVGNPITRAFFWDFFTGTQTIPLLPGFASAQAYGLNNLGHVVGDMKDSKGHAQAFLWDSVNGTRAIANTVGGAARDSHAYSINDKDQVVGTAANSSGSDLPYLWSSVSGMQAIVNTVGGIGGNAFGVNNAGTIVGDAPAGSSSAAFKTTTISGMTDVTPSWATAARSRNTNQLGDIIGSGPIATNEDRHGFVIASAGGAITDIHNANVASSLSGHLDFNTADDPQGINDLGQIVGTVKFHPDIGNPADFDYHAFIWDSLHQMRDLNDMLPAGANLTLFQGAAINNRGQIVCWADVGVVILNPPKRFDINGDGNADLVNQYLSGSDLPVGQVAFWRMSGSQVLGGMLATGGGNGVLPTGWSVNGTADINGDGKQDLVLQHTSGQVAFWMLNGTQVGEGVVAFGGSNGILPAGWSVTGAVDTNGDGKPDLILQHTGGQVAFWIMDGAKVVTGVLASGNGNGLLPSGWRVAGSGDINGDGLPDLVLHNTSGQIAFWLMNGSQVVNGSAASGVMNGILPTDWSVVGVDDYNNDGLPDLALMQSGGQVAFWFLNGSVVTGGISASGAGNGILPAGWRVQGPR